MPYTYEDLFEILSGDPLSDDYSPDYGYYGAWERDVATPRLTELGYTNVRWIMGERDSFGPLSRVCICRDDKGNTRRFIYG